MAFTLVLTKLPKPQQPIGLAVFALSVTLRRDRTHHRRLSDRKLRLADHFLRHVLPTLVMVTALYLTWSDSRCSSSFYKR